MQTVLVVFVASTFSFLLLHVAPGDPVYAVAGVEGMTPELRAQRLHELGYDRPLPEQYGKWLGRVAKGDFGRSTWLQRDVIDVIGDRLPNTLLLMSLALAASIMFGSMLGAWQGARADSLRDRAVSFVSMVLYSVPEFWFALGLMFVFAYRLHVLPASGMVDEALHDTMSPWGRVIDRARHLALPWTSLTVMGTAIFARYQRVSMIETLREPFVRTARAKGLPESTARRQAWTGSLLPVVTLIGLFFPALLTGAVFVENVFGWPGMGTALLNAIFKRDFELVSGCVIIGSAMTALGSLLADILRAAVDPRLRSA